jgi:hypothetical protein
VVAFWKLYEKKLPTWAQMAKKFMTLQPSSAAIERVWSLFSNFFGDNGKNSLIDFIFCVLALKYNA